MWLVNLNIDKLYYLKLVNPKVFITILGEMN